MRASSGPYIAADVASACRGSIICGAPDTEFRAISTDSRDIKPGDLFVPLKGANFDGNDFIVPALEAGARGSLCDGDVNREIRKILSSVVLLQVQNTLRALSDLASTHPFEISRPPDRSHRLFGQNHRQGDDCGRAFAVESSPCFPGKLEQHDRSANDSAQPGPRSHRCRG